ncbi:DNA topoisomerase IV subunit B [Malacoplasma penetrans]|uniref:DNA topoisomerase (ATP-hydrolyzing) n=1 Tax=Malacoplasma penetrans (strain HF-2) TaxID=272633 RepID=Q8EVB8_MALP2|nr:DNA topoisomerase IV subunit B [Malacoplasma penetrans]RXY96433.1 DNA topoisomerase IV subunit B [Malacoplasma penetrans]BAC44438.1 DNA topoisomerase IV subunit B [Malacoplasma penetrans HF-2]
MNSYKESDIKVLEGLDPVRKRPGMYIGSTDQRGLHHLIWEILDNAVDEVMAGVCDTIKMTLHRDGSFSVEDNGRGIPTGIHPKTKMSTVDTVFTTLHAGGKFSDSAYKMSGGLHGVGSSVVNALSSYLTVTVKRDGKIYESQYVDGGKIKQKSHIIGSTNRTGTTVRFLPDASIFKNIAFSPSIIFERVQETSFLFKGLKIIFENEYTRKVDTFLAQNGISEFVSFISSNQKTISEVIYIEGKEQDIEAEIAFQYNDSNSETFVSFANSVKTKEGGTHETGFKTALTETLNDYARKWKLLKDKEKNFEGSDFREGLVCVISVRIPERLISYEGQTKNKLFTQEAYSVVKNIVKTKFTYWLEENKKDAKTIIEKAYLSREARIAAKKAREEVKQLKGQKKEKILSGKLTPCQSKDKTITELFLVEGDSAGGSAKLGRDKRYQAILPLKGKVINVEKAMLKDLLKNEEISTIISSIGGSIGSDFCLPDVKYSKIIIMTDADTDGAHIRILLLTFFYRYMKELIESGRVYIALPPLYKFTNTKNKKEFYVWEDYELEELKKDNPNYEIQRYKGLGEMNADQLWDTTMDPETRQLIQVSIEDAALTERRVSILMGDDSSKRKEWITDNVDFEMEG